MQCTIGFCDGDRMNLPKINPSLLHWLEKKKKTELILMIVELHETNLKMAKVLKGEFE